MNRYLLTFILIISLFVENLHANGVGVVMSGGGAKGLYHVGVLEALEESGVPIDYVAGTSMGAIVGALYASGYTAQQIREMARSGEIESWALGKFDKDYRSYFRSGSTLLNESAPLSLKLDVTKKRGAGAEAHRDESQSDGSRQNIPRSVIPTVPLDMAIAELFSPASVACGGDFRDLMVPFLCVASDVTDNTKVLFTEGDLGVAVRASMAIPLAFKPIVDERGHMLYDGALQDNFPWRDMESCFAPDLLIGSVCGVDHWADTRDMSVIDQAFFITMNVSDYTLPEGSIKIARDVPVGVLDFKSAEKVIDMGYHDTMAKIDSILSRIPESQRRSKEEVQQRREAFLKRCPELKFSSYDTTGLNERQRTHAINYMATTPRERRRGADLQREMNFAELKRSLFTVLSSGDYETSYPTLTYDAESERFKFEIEMEHRPKLKLSIGGNISSTPFNQIYLGVSHTKIEQIASTLFMELYLGPLYNTSRMGYRADFYHRAPMFIDTYLNFSSKSLNHGDFGHITDVDNTLDVKSMDLYASLGIGAPIMRKAMATLRFNGGVESFDYDASVAKNIVPNVESCTIDRSRLAYSAAKIELEHNTIDNEFLPSSGSKYSISAVGVLARESGYAEIQPYSYNTTYEQTFRVNRSWFGVKGSFVKYFNFDRHKAFTLGVSAEALFSNVPYMFTTTARQLIMPAYQPIAHMQMVNMPEFSATRYLGVGVMPNIKLWRDISLRLATYAMVRDATSNANILDGLDEIEVHHILQASLAYDSPIGAVTLAATKYGIESLNNLYLTFNFGFTIFSPRGTFY